MAGETVITVIGNLTSDPELRFTPSGAAVANFTVASTPRTFDRQSQEWKDGEALFLRCNVWRQAAENVAESLTRGSRVMAQGRLKQEERVAVLPLLGLAIQGARGGGDGEVGNRRPRGREAQLGVAGQVADDGDDSLAGHDPVLRVVGAALG